MSRHTIAINVLKDQLGVVTDNIRIIRDENIRLGMVGMIQPNREYAIKAYGVRYKNMMRNLITEGNALMEAIKVLEGDS